jgi:hypothetical protein
MIRPPVSRVALALLLSWAIKPALADSGACTINKAVDEIQLNDLNQEADEGKQSVQLLNQLSELSNKAKNPNKPVGEQLDPADNEKFGELRAQLIHTQAYNFIQSNRARDAEVIAQMYDVALKSYSDPSYNPSADLAKSPGSAVIFLRVMQPNQIDYVPSTDTTCTIDFALSQAQAQLVQQMTSALPIIQRDKPIIEALRAKYGVAAGGQFDRSKMSEDDVQTLDLIQNEVKPALTDLTLALDLSNIRAWWGVSELIYNDDLQDLQKTDDPNNIGDTIRSQVSSFSPAIKAVAAVWNMVDAKVPNDNTTQFQQMQVFLQKMGH